MLKIYFRLNNLDEMNKNFHYYLRFQKMKLFENDSTTNDDNVEEIIIDLDLNQDLMMKNMKEFFDVLDEVKHLIDHSVNGSSFLQKNKSNNRI